MLQEAKHVKRNQQGGIFCRDNPSMQSEPCRVRLLHPEPRMNYFVLGGATTT